MRKIFLLLVLTFSFQLLRAFSCSYAAGLPWVQGPGEFASGQYSSTKIENSVLIFHLDEDSGTFAGDVSGYGNNGTLGAAQWGTGKIGGAANCGAGGSISVADANSLDLTNKMTILLWARYDSDDSNNLYPIKKANSYVVRRDNSGEGSDISSFIMIDASFEPRASSGFVPVLGEWFHAAVTFDGTTMKLYINGELKGSIERSGSIEVSANPVAIGSNWPGLIDEVKIYNSCFSSDEIKADYGGSGFFGRFLSPGGVLESTECDCEESATLGRMDWVADVPQGCTLSFYASIKDELTGLWAETGPYRSSGSILQLPPSRYIKYRAQVEIPSNSRAEVLLKEVKIYPALQGIASSNAAGPTLIFKNEDKMTLDLYFNVPMDSNNGSCFVDLTDENNVVIHISTGDGTWIDSMHFQTKPFDLYGQNISGGFASLTITGPNPVGNTNTLYSYASNVLLIDASDINPLASQFFPNPFSPNGDGKADQTTLLLLLPSPTTITVKIYDLKGRLVKVLVENRVGMGEGIIWDGTDDLGRICPVGLYICQIRMDNEFKSGSVVLAK